MSANIPPKQSVTGTPTANGPQFEAPFGAPAAEQPGALVSIHNAALHANPDSFPVLKAFQDYLEDERKRARQRLIMLSAFFAILLVVVMIALISIGVYIFGNMSRTQSHLLTAVLEQRSPPAQTAAPAVITPAPVTTAQPALPPPDADTIARIIEERVTAALAATRPKAEPVTTAPPAAQARNEELEAIKATLAELKRENEVLRTQPKRPPTVGPIIPRAEVAHILDRHAAAAGQSATPPAPQPVTAMTPAIPPAAATTAAATVAPAPAVTPPPASADSEASMPQQPAAAAPEKLAATPPAEASRPNLGSYDNGRLTLTLPSKTAGATIPWRVSLPPRD